MEVQLASRNEPHSWSVARGRVTSYIVQPAGNMDGETAPLPEGATSMYRAIGAILVFLGTLDTDMLRGFPASWASLSQWQ
jgi:hypothetical protein